MIALAIAWATIVQSLGWAQTANFTLVRALSSGTAQIDDHHWETRDKSYYKGHFYSVKAPGMAFLSLPAYMLLDAAGADDLARNRVESARAGGAFRWYKAGVLSDQYGPNIETGRIVRAEIENYTPIVWTLGLLVVVLPALILMLLVRACAERLVPGTGTAAAIALGAGTLIMPFATLYFSHVLSAALAFGCFVVLWREREGPPRLALLAAAGALSGFAVTSEYPLAIAALILGLYAISRGNIVRRGLAYSGGVLAGIAPLLIYNLSVFGSVTHFSYANAVAEQGASGRDVIGLNDGGLFGIGAPSISDGFDLLFASKGLFVISPVLMMSVVGTYLMYRRGRRAEALVVGSIFAAFLVYNSGYWLPFGGGSPGPRFLIPVLPFLAFPLALALRRFPSTTLALAIPSILTMTIATMTLPMIGNGDTGFWAHLVGIGNFEHTVASAFGFNNGWTSQVPFLAAMVAMLALAVSATPLLDYSRDALVAVAAVIGWGLASALTRQGPPIGTGGGHDLLPFVFLATAVSLLAVTAAVAASRRQPVDDQVVAKLAADPEAG